MKIAILCSSAAHPVNPYLLSWANKHQNNHEISIVRSKNNLSQGDLLFLVSCSELLSASDLQQYTKSLVIHASDLPLGRGWSPHIWEIVNGATNVTVTLLEAGEKVDSGAIWHQLKLGIPKDALCDEINQLLFETELQLMCFAVENFNTVKPEPQSSTVQPSYHPRRSPSHSQINPKKSIEEQFDLIRVCDPNRFPAYFELYGKRYIIRLEKI